jgi:hypothetical protein
LLKNGKFGSLLQAILGIVAVLGILVMFVSVSAFLLYVQLAITRSKYETETLLRQGYPHSKIISWYGKQLAIIMVFIAILTTTLLIGVKSYTNQYIETFGFEAPSSINQFVLLGGLSLVCILWLVQYFAVRKQIYKLK